MTAASVLAPVLVPVRVSVRAVVPLNATAPVLAKVTGPLPLASSAPADAPVPRVNSRLVLATGPVYRRVPPFRTRLAAALVETPRLLGNPAAAALLSTARLAGADRVIVVPAMFEMVVPRA